MGNVDKSDLILVLRTNNERTIDICKELAAAQVGEDKIVVINEKPFFKAVIKTFEIGIKSQSKYLIALDADILLFSDAIEYMMEEANNMDSDWFRMDFPIYDKFRGRVTGVHFYNNKYSERFYDYLLANDKTNAIRPEYNSLREFCEMRNLIYNYIPHYIVGKHDYFQYYNDIYRKYTVRERRSHLEKNTEILYERLRKFNESYIDDYDYFFALRAFEDSMKGCIREGNVSEEFGIKEKMPIGKKEEIFIKKNCLKNRIMNKYVRK